ncbi:S8 family serine peptidase [Kytococcus sp. Marseille-QA3725]
MSRSTLRLGATFAAIAMAGTLGGTGVSAGPLTGSDQAAPQAAGSPWSTAAGVTADEETTRQLVLGAEGAKESAVREAVEAAGGEVTDVNDAIGLYTVNAPANLSELVAGNPAVAGVMNDRIVGYTPGDDVAERVARADEVETLRSKRADHPATEKSRGKGHDGIPANPGQGKGKGKPKPGPVPEGDSLSDRQWNLDMIDAPEAHRTATGKGVRVGVIDTGIDGNHPDVRANFNAELSRNFTTDLPEIDGECEHEGCKDPADIDQGGHGTHVASTIASARNGHGIVGVAPEAELVNLRGGQDSGYFFLEPTLEALTYAPSAGVDVVNMSYYIDPWAFNCPDNEADSPEEQAQQQFTIEATNRALKYAKDNGITLVSSLGNSALDLGKVTTDDSSPDFPEGSEKERTIDSSCLDLPVEGYGTQGVSAVGPSGMKAYYSNYGLEQIHVAAPGGAFRDFFGTDKNERPENLILAAAPEEVLREEGEIDEDGMPTSDFVVREETPDGEIAYYQYMQGTSMASPHVSGVAALAIDAKGQPDKKLGGKKMQPKRVDSVVAESAHERACDAETLVYPGLGDEYTAVCEGDEAFNGFYGHGIINAVSAVSRTPGKH